MNRQELQTLRGQAVLLAGLFAGSIVVAAVIAGQRGFFERHVREKYAALPVDLRPLADAAAGGVIDGEQFAGLNEQQRLALYDNWMGSSEPGPENTPGALVVADAGLYIARAERTVVCGKVEQQFRALEFLRLAGSQQAIPALRKARAWALKRDWAMLAAQIAETIDYLSERGSPEAFPATYPTTTEATAEDSRE
jgi:hypothetical protein